MEWVISSSSAGDQSTSALITPPGPTDTPRADLIPLTVPEVRRLLWAVVWRAFPTVEHVLAWSVWRRHHQAVAKRCHYRRRGVILPQLQL